MRVPQLTFIQRSLMFTHNPFVYKHIHASHTLAGHPHYHTSPPANTYPLLLLFPIKSDHPTTDSASRYMSPVLFGAGTHTHTGRNSDSQHAYLLLKVVSFHHSQSAKLAHCQIVIKSLTIRFCACVFSAKTAETVSILKTRRAKMRAGNETERRLKAAAVVKQQKRLCRRLLFFTD